MKHIHIHIQRDSCGQPKTQVQCLGTTLTDGDCLQQVTLTSPALDRNVHRHLWKQEDGPDSLSIANAPAC